MDSLFLLQFACFIFMFINAFIVQLPSSLHIRVNNIQERENQTKIPGKWGKKRLRIFP